MERSDAWRTQYRAARALGSGHRDAVLKADTHFGKRRRDRGLPPLDTPYQAIQSKGDKRGRVKPKYQEWPEDAVKEYLLTGVEYSEPSSGSTISEMVQGMDIEADDGDAPEAVESVQRRTGRARRRLQQLGRFRRRGRSRARALPPMVRQKRLRDALLGQQSAADIVRAAAAERATTPEEVIAEVTAATETYSTSDNPGQAAEELAAAAQQETDAAAAEAALLAAQVLSYTQALAATPSSAVAPDLTTGELLDAYQTVPFPTIGAASVPYYPMPTVDPTCPTCTTGAPMASILGTPQFPGLMGSTTPAFAPGGNLPHLMGAGIPNRFGSSTQRTAIPLVSNQAIAAGANIQLALQPVSDIEPGAVMWVSFTGSTIPPEITALSVSGQNQLYGVAGAGLSQAFADVANQQAPGVFIPVRIIANNSFQVTITNRDAANPIQVDVALIGTAVQLVQALAVCGATP